MTVLSRLRRAVEACVAVLLIVMFPGLRVEATDDSSQTKLTDHGGEDS